MDAGQFLDALRKLRVEATQFLNVMDFGAENSLAEWVDALLHSVLGKVATLLDAAYASIRTIGESPSGGIRLSVGSPQNSELLTLEIRDRDAEMIGMAEFRAREGVVFTEATQRRLRDFEKVFGLLLEICIRTKDRPAAN
jgi:hypothetical protein